MGRACRSEEGVICKSVSEGLNEIMSSQLRGMETGLGTTRISPSILC